MTEVENLKKIIKTDFNKFKESTISKINKKLENNNDDDSNKISLDDFQLIDDIKYIKFDITNISTDLVNINESKKELKHKYNDVIDINLTYQIDEDIGNYINEIETVKNKNRNMYDTKITTFVEDINNDIDSTIPVGNQDMETLYNNLKLYYNKIKIFNYQEKVLYILNLLYNLNDNNKEHLIHFFLFDKNDKLVTQIINSIIDDTKNVEKTNFITSI